MSLFIFHVLHHALQEIRLHGVKIKTMENRKMSGRTQWRHDLRCYLHICLDIRKHWRQDGRSPSRSWKPVPLKYEVLILITRTRLFVTKQKKTEIWP